MRNETHAFNPELFLPIHDDLRVISGLLDDCPAEAPVYSMTASDEITQRLPDALFNGVATVKLIENCIPNIKDAWLLPAHRLTYILAALRIATAGPALTLTITCPDCEIEGTYDADLSAISDAAAAIVPLEQLVLTINGQDVHVEFASINYRDMTTHSLHVFKDQKTLENLKKMNEPNTAQQARLVQSINDSKVFWVTKNIGTITTWGDPQTRVTDTNHIGGFVGNMDKVTFDEIQEHIESYTKTLKTKLDCTCASCSFQFATEFSLDQSVAFRAALLTRDGEEIKEYIESFENDIGDIKTELLRSVWFMRGGVTYLEMLRMSQKERRLINKLVKDNLKITKDSSLPFF